MKTVPDKQQVSCLELIFTLRRGLSCCIIHMSIVSVGVLITCEQYFGAFVGGTSDVEPLITLGEQLFSDD
jgi:hypothetical protein